MENPLSITFGIEIEFVLVYLIPEELEIELSNEVVENDVFQQLADKTDEQYAKVRAALDDAGLEVCPGEDDDYRRWVVDIDPSVELDQEEEKKVLETWTDRSGRTLPPGKRARLRHIDVEVISPVLQYSSESFSQVYKAVTAISDLPTLAPKSSALHVHVGNRSFGFPVETVKNVALLASCFEPQFNSLHTPERLSNPFCVLPRFMFETEVRGNLIKMVETISCHKNLNSLKRQLAANPDRLLGPGDRELLSRYRCYNFENLKKSDKRTIEFRQHEGTLAYEEIARWIRFVCNLVNLAHTIELGIVLDVIRQYAQDEDCDILSLLTWLGLSGSAKDYKENIYHHPHGSGGNYKRGGTF
ncbi:hypothetical protein MMC14_008017 [Varicellaria rhodocarpa]|nr:hypothetical protein [Varicellaria rhodocarpa]